MITSQTYTIPREEGKIQKVLVVRADSWEGVHFISPKPEPDRAFKQLVYLYKEYHIARYSWLYGQLVFFRLTDDISVPGTDTNNPAERLAAAARILKKGLAVRHGKTFFRTAESEHLYKALLGAGLIDIACGRRNKTYILPVEDGCGFLSECDRAGAAVANLSFFIMDPFDCSTVYDFIGRPIGLRVEDGRILSAPQYGRPMFLVKKDGTAFITENLEDPRIDPIHYEINGKRIGAIREHTSMFSPLDIVKDTVAVSADRVISVTHGRSVTIPTSGFTTVFQTKERIADFVKPGDSVNCLGMTDIQFGLQVGPVAVKNGVPQVALADHFYHATHILHNLITLTGFYPPALFRAEPKKDRAPRMVLGNDKDNKPMLIWFEGAAKFRHDPKQDSCGATMEETAMFSAELGMKNGIHLDGGGSAQILIDGKRALKISDRNSETGEEQERAVPNGIVFR